MQENLLPTCPHCTSPNVTYKAKVGIWDCGACERQFAGAPPSTDLANPKRLLSGIAKEPKAIFFSYGHDGNQPIVDRFKADLEKRGHSVWIDYKEIGTWSDWRGKITEGIHNSNLALAFLSKHATRDPGVCRNEIAMALNKFGTIYPILLEAEKEVALPVTISHIQWQDLSQWKEIRDGAVAGKDWERWYEEKLIQIIALVEGEASEFEGDINHLRAVLKPITFSGDIARHIPQFIGREWLFEAYNDWLENQPKSRLFWIKAGPGVGKTAIAAMLAHKHQIAVVGAWFCQANSIERRDTHNALCTLAFQLCARWPDYRRKLLLQLGFNASTKKEDWDDLREALLNKNEADLFNHLFIEPLTGLIWRDNRLVVVIDALDEATDQYGQNPLVDLIVTRLAHLPEWISFVVTSRPNPEVVAKLQGFNPFELDTEDKRNLADLSAYLDAGLAKHADFIKLPESEQTRIKAKLLDHSQGMILYLQQVLRGLEEKTMSLEQLESIPRGLYGLYSEAFTRLYGGDKLQSVYDPEVKPLLRLLLASPGALPAELAQQVLGWDKETYLRRRNLLGSYVEDTPKGSRLFHKTLLEWLSDEISAPYYLDQQSAKLALATFLWSRFEATEDRYQLEWPSQTKEWLPAWFELLPQWDEADALGNFGYYLTDVFNLSAAELFLRRALAIQEKSLGPDHPDVASSLNKLAMLLSIKSDYEGAEPLYRRALVIREKALGPDHPTVAGSLNNLANLLYRKADYEGAEPLFHRALAIQGKALGPDHPDVATSLSSLAALLYSKDDYEGTEPLFRRALAIQEKALGPDHPDVATSLNNLATLLYSKDDYEGAEPLYRRALAIKEKSLGPDHPDVAPLLNNLATLLTANAGAAGAEPLYRRALAIQDKALGPDHPDVAASLNNLATLLNRKADYEGAEPLYRRALAIWEKSLGPDHPFVATALSNLAVLLYNKAGYEGAEPLYRRELAILEKALGPDHPDVKTTLNNQAVLLNSKADYEGAESLYRRELAILEKALGPDHPDVAIPLNTLANLLYSKADYEGAEPLYRRVLAILETSLGPDHPDVANSLNNLANLLNSKDDYEGAEPLYRRELAIYESSLGTDHPYVAISLNNLAALLYSKDDYEGAEPLYRRTLAILEKLLGPDHPNLVNSLNNLAALLNRKADYEGAEPLYRRTLAILGKTLGPDHPDIATSLNSLAEVLYSKSDYAGAEPLYRRVLAIREKSHGPDHPNVAISLNNLAEALDNKGDYAGAEQMFRRISAIREKSFGPEDPEAIESFRRVGRCLREQGRLNDALEIFLKVLETRQRILGVSHEDTLFSQSSLGMLYRMQGELVLARATLNDAMGKANETLGEDNWVAEDIRKELELLG